jgi:hypothetical protein
VLMHTGVLEERNEYLERMAPWLKRFLATQPAEHARVIEPFATWYVLRRARRRAETRGFTAGSSASARRLIRHAANLLDWLSERQQSLATMTQCDIDEWLEGKGGRRHEIRFFIAWTSSCGIGPDLHVQAPGRSTIGQMVDEEERQQCLKRCISDEQLPLDVRVAGALVAPYGLTISRITRLTHTDIQTRDGDVYLSIDKSPLVLPPPVA